ncbi:hypothetical protein Salat_1427200 [Sesamum alatum]|uniref:Uncharacterized protein n=1 Tax=Sesamum alatum TaxID=300844 RepID=A0AAE1YB55_9LAMI|nr:hypothetical protein Salat_1427200 [Sesamum alatum]
MEATLLSGSLRLPINRRLSSTNPSCHRRNTLLVHAKQGESHREGESVDENLFVLSIRIKKRKTVEAVDVSHDHDQARRVPCGEGERKLSVDCHDRAVVEAVELLKSCFVSAARPSVVVGVIALAVLSVVPLTTTNHDVVANVVRVVKTLLAGCHVGVDIDF